MSDDLVFADSAGHIIIDIEAARAASSEEPSAGEPPEAPEADGAEAVEE